LTLTNTHTNTSSVLLCSVALNNGALFWTQRESVMGAPVPVDESLLRKKVMRILVDVRD
jgi:hypothetical protein